MTPLIRTVCCIGVGYLGGLTMAVIADRYPENQLTLVDLKAERIVAENGPDLTRPPMYEQGLGAVVGRVRREAKAARGHTIVMEGSTLPVRPAAVVQEMLGQADSAGAAEDQLELTFSVLSNPDFLAEGTAMTDLEGTDRVLIGGGDPNAVIEESRHRETHLIPLVLDSAYGRSQVSATYGEDYDTPKGTYMSDSIYITDLTQAHVLVLQPLEMVKASRCVRSSSPA